MGGFFKIASFALFAALIAAKAALFADSPFRFDFAFTNAYGVLSAYEGIWRGRETLCIMQKPFINFDTENTYLRKDKKTLIGSGVVSSRGIPVKVASVMEVKDGRLTLKVKSGNSDKTMEYVGQISFNKVLWYRPQKIFMLEFTEDVFSKKDGFVVVSSYGVHPYTTKKGGGVYIESYSQILRRANSPLPDGKSGELRELSPSDLGDLML